MKLENQLCTVEQAERLRELGIIQTESHFYYTGEKWGIMPKKSCDFINGRPLALFTVSEMQEMDGTLGNIMISARDETKGAFYSQVATLSPNWEDKFRYSNTYAQCFGEKLIRGLEQGYYTAGECNERLINA